MSSTWAIGFDTTEVLGLPEVRTPVMLYLLDVMDESVNGERLASCSDGSKLSPLTWTSISPG
jgi:type IV secretory pathway VirB4 component